jgi:hypothetical protein
LGNISLLLREEHNNFFWRMFWYEGLKGDEYLLALGIFLIIIGVSMVIEPSLFWLITESWKSNDGTEPSKLYIWSTRFGGIIVTVVGFSSVIVAFL